MRDSDPRVRIVFVHRLNSDLNSVLTLQKTGCDFQHGPNFGVPSDPTFRFRCFFNSWQSVLATSHCICDRCTEKNFEKIYACSHVSIVRLVQSIILVSRDFHSQSSPLYHLPGELVSLSSVPMLSIDLNLWNLSRPSAFVPMSLGFTSVLD